MVRHLIRLWALGLLLFAIFAGTHHAAAAAPPSGSASWALQSDGFDPGLPKELDPDDDDDGVPDSVDSHPNDPTRGSNPPAGPTDPIADDDGDGLPNVMDPDDNNNGIPDRTEGVSAGGETPSSGQPPSSGTGGSTTSSSGGQSLVRALPSTGTGRTRADTRVPILLIGGTVLLATGHWTRRRTRP